MLARSWGGATQETHGTLREKGKEGGGLASFPCLFDHVYFRKAGTPIWAPLSGPPIWAPYLGPLSGHPYLGRLAVTRRHERTGPYLSPIRSSGICAGPPASSVRIVLAMRWIWQAAPPNPRNGLSWKQWYS